jgi:hypothetical protein
VVIEAEKMAYHQFAFSIVLYMQFHQNNKRNGWFTMVFKEKKSLKRDGKKSNSTPSYNFVKASYF